MTAQLFIGSLSRDTQERDLENVFFKHGKLLRCDLKRGFGFVEYESPRDAEEAIRAENGRRLLGSRIVVEWAKGSVGDKAPRHRDRSRSRDRDFGARPPRRRSPPRGGFERDRSPPRYGNSFDYRDRRRSLSPRRNFRDDRFDRDRFGGGGGGRFERDRGTDRRYDRDRFTRRY
ncbi:serine/arginine-rich splicing factor 3-like isoform X1 [Rhopilema esculentum]|uniref:serine/arginine-rich splicing factor 3-like isoform X1 n=1 Tax=Rhopilema esculentum TaxID=499914 RepID=UPI0031E2CFA4|eukprot:gene11455-21663_t